MSEIPSDLSLARKVMNGSARKRKAWSGSVFPIMLRSNWVIWCLSKLPEEGATFAQGDACAVVESVKAASDIYCRFRGEIVAINDNRVNRQSRNSQLRPTTVRLHTCGWISEEAGDSDGCPNLQRTTR